MIDEEISYRELAQRCGLGESDLKRMVRSAIAHDIFCETRRDIVAHRALSKIVAQAPRLRQWTGWVVEDLWPASTRTIDAMIK